MRKKNNPNQWSQSDPGGNGPDASSPPSATFAHYLFELSSPEGLIEAAAIPPPPPQPGAVKLPNLPDSLFTNLPDFLKRVVAGSSAKKEERDLLILGALVSLSACFHKIHGYYAGFKVYPNLFLFVAALSSEDKGYLSLCKHLVLPVHNALKDQGQLMKQQQKIETRRYKKLPERGLLIPAGHGGPAVF